MTLYAQGIHRGPAGFLVEAGSVVPALQGRDEVLELAVGNNAVVQGPILQAGPLCIGKAALLWSGIHGGAEVAIGAYAQVRGPLIAEGNAVIQAGATIHGPVQAAGDVYLLGDCTVGDVTAGGDIVIVGSPKTGRLLPGGRIQTRPW